MNTDKLNALMKLSHELGREDRGLAMLGEGNTSARASAETFLVKASGACLGTMREEDIVECRFDALLPLMNKSNLSDAEIEKALLDSRVDAKAKKPSVEALFHAYFLGLPDIEYVGHTHGTAVNGILCSPRAREFANNRMFPDEIVCCGMASVLVPYVDPGIPLAQAIRHHTEEFIRAHQRQPRVILMVNHGIITVGATPAAVLSAMFMAEKAAKIWLAAAALGGPVYLSDEHVKRIAGRPDEHYRQRALGL